MDYSPIVLLNDNVYEYVKSPIYNPLDPRVKRNIKRHLIAEQPLFRFALGVSHSYSHYSVSRIIPAVDSRF